MKNKSVLNSPRLLKLKKGKRKIFKKKIFLWSFFIFLTLVGFSFLSRWDEINIDDIQIFGNKAVEAAEIEEIIKEKVSDYYLWFFPKTNFLLYPKNGIKKELAQKFKRLENISLNVRDFKTLEVSLSERLALYTWCGNTLPESNNPRILSLNKEKCYFLDKDGYIFDGAPYFSGGVYIKFYGTIVMKGGLSAQADDFSGSYFLQSDFKKLVSFKETLEKIGIKPAAFYIEDVGDVRMFLSSSSAGEMGPEVIFKIDSDFREVLENLQSVLRAESLQSDFKNEYSSLLYIDLRFGNKIYYKFK